MHEREINEVIASKKSIHGVKYLFRMSSWENVFTTTFCSCNKWKGGEMKAITGTASDISDIKNAEEIWKERRVV